MSPSDDDERAYRRHTISDEIPGGIVTISGITREAAEAAYAKWLAWLEANQSGFKGILFLEPGMRLEIVMDAPEEDHGDHR